MIAWKAASASEYLLAKKAALAASRAGVLAGALEGVALEAVLGGNEHAVIAVASSNAPASRPRRPAVARGGYIFQHDTSPGLEVRGGNRGWAQNSPGRLQEGPRCASAPCTGAL